MRIASQRAIFASIVLCILTSGFAAAQGPGYPPYPGQQPAENDSWMPNWVSKLGGGVVPLGKAAEPQMVDPTAAWQPVAHESHQPMMGPYGGPGQPGGPYGPPDMYGPGSPTGYETEVFKGEGVGQGALGRLWQNAVRDSFLRVEYLLWDIEAPGNNLLGEAPAGVADPTTPFTVGQAVNPINGITTARALNLADIGLDDNNGVRVTWGVPLTFGTFEVSAFMLEEATQPRRPGELPSTTQAIAFPTTVDGGNPTNLVRLFEQDFHLNYSSDVYGINANVIFDQKILPGEGLKWYPISGVRFVNIQEQMTATGMSSAFPGVESLVDSDTRNHILAPNLGIGVDLVHRWFTLGVRPQFGLGVNNYRATVTTANFVSATDPETRREMHETKLTPTAQIDIYLRLNIKKNFRVWVGYSRFWASKVARPHEVVDYDLLTAGGVGAIPTGTNFTLHERLEDWTTGGLVVGGEYIFGQK